MFPFSTILRNWYFMSLKNMTPIIIYNHSLRHLLRHTIIYIMCYTKYFFAFNFKTFALDKSNLLSLNFYFVFNFKTFACKKFWIGFFKFLFCIPLKAYEKLCIKIVPIKISIYILLKIINNHFANRGKCACKKLVSS